MNMKNEVFYGNEVARFLHLITDYLLIVYREHLISIEKQNLFLI